MSASDGTLRVCDWNLVSTSVGAMVESRCLTRRPGDTIQNEDILDSTFTDVQRLAAVGQTGNYALEQLAYGSSQWPHYRDNDPLVVE